MEDHDLQSILKQLTQLEKRVHDLETIIDGSSKRKPGRKSKLSLTQKMKLSRNMRTAYPIPSSQKNTKYQEALYVTSAEDITP